MPPLLAPCPLMLDQSFPRDANELRVAAAGVGELDAAVRRGEASLVLTTSLRAILWGTDWFRTDNDMTLLTEVFRYLQQLFLMSHAQLVVVDLAGIEALAPHPAPVGTPVGQCRVWRDEIGRLLTIHDAALPKSGKFYIGIASAREFAGLGNDAYESSVVRAFPLLDPKGISALEDAYEYIEPRRRLRPIRVADVHRNFRAIGATAIDPPRRDSHYKVRFLGRRSWPLDPNVDPIPLRFLDELGEIAGLPTSVLRGTLITGQVPSKQLRLIKYVA